MNNKGKPSQAEKGNFSTQNEAEKSVLQKGKEEVEALLAGAGKLADQHGSDSPSAKPEESSKSIIEKAKDVALGLKNKL